MQDKSQIVFGVAWWRPEQWDRLRQISEDAEQLTDSYEEWLASAEQHLKSGVGGGVGEKVDIDVEELLAWCNEKGIPVNGKSRSEYVVEVLRSRDKNLQKNSGA